MPLKLIAPGKRKGNRHYLVRGQIGGQRYEVSTDTRDKAAAEIFKADFELAVRQNRVPGPGEAVTFARAAELYVNYKSPPKTDRDRIDRLVARIGTTKLVGDVGHADFVDAANFLYPDAKNETKNRSVIKPGAAIIHYAANSKWCAWQRITKFKEAPVKTRASNDTVAALLLAAIEADRLAAIAAHAKARTSRDRLIRLREIQHIERKALLVLWLFRHWNRVSDPLRLTWADVNLTDGTYEMLVAKGNAIRVKPLDDDVRDAMANLTGAKTGPIFPWKTRSGVYAWLRPLTQKLKVEFTPHMARHYGGKQLNRIGAGIKTVMGALDHADPASSARYMDADLEIIRDAQRRTRAGK